MRNALGRLNHGSPSKAQFVDGRRRAPCAVLARMIANSLVVLVVGCGLQMGLIASSAPSHAAEIELPLADKRKPIQITARTARQWQKGAHQVWLLSGDVRIGQGSMQALAREAVLWVDRRERYSAHASTVIAYLEGEVRVDFGQGGTPHRVSGRSAQTLHDDSWFGRFHTIDEIEIRAPIVGGEPDVKPAVYRQGLDARLPQAAHAQFLDPSLPVSARSLSVLPRDSVGVQLDVRNLPERNESVAVVSSGVRVIIEDVSVRGQQPQPTPLGKVEIETDRMVVWTADLPSLLGAAGGQAALQDRNTALELYLEGNIVFRQGDSVIYAERMYYNARQQYGVIIDAEMLTPAPGYQGLIRLKASLLQAVGRRSFEAYNAAITTSRMGHPKYWMGFQELLIRDEPEAAVDPFTGQPVFDPITGEQQTEHHYRATARNNAIYVGSLPVFYWPVMSSDLSRPSVYLEGFKVGNDNVFGAQIYTDWNLYNLLGLQNPPEGTEWLASLDYLSERGPAAGTTFTYERDRGLWFSGRTQGLIDVWGIDDSGLDNLGRDRRELAPEEDLRGRLLWQHQQRLGNDWFVTGEVGWISDRNFLEQYFETEWDTYKDLTTGVEIKKYFDANSISVSGDARVNEFFTQTQWLPRLDHFQIGQSLGPFSWYGHSSIGYAKLKTATAPLDPADAVTFDPLAWEQEAEGIRAVTRQELELPLMLGPLKVAPFVSGEVGYWEQDIFGEELTRMLGQAGVRANLPITGVHRNLSSELLNLNGLAHKIDLRGQLFYADSDQDMQRLPLYDPLDDDAIEAFRRRFYFNTFGGLPGGDVALRFDERFFALRGGMQRWVTSPSMEIADDLVVGQLGIHQRLQTKRGPAGAERIVDWMVLDVQGSYFPDEERDNFGQTFGLFDYDYRWHVGDRFTLLSDGYFDFFDEGLKTYNAGGLLSRPDRGGLYVGYRGVTGPFRSDVLMASINYRLSHKWVMETGGSYDFGPTGNIGQTLSLTRVGESALIRIGFRSDSSRDNIGAMFSIEPRFLPGGRLGRVGGVRIPPTGAEGLE